MSAAVAARPRVVSERTQFALQAALLVVLLALGLLIAAQGNGYTAQLLFNVALSVLLASGWNVIGGMTGYVSFGQVSFFGLGAYAAAIGVLHLALPWLIAALAATAAATALAIPLGLIMLRLNGIFFALGMFGLARILQIAANALNITGGPMGTTVPAAEGPALPAAVAVLVAAVAVGAVAVLMRTRLGLRLMAIRDDPVAAEAAGVNVWLAKVAAFCLGAGFAAIGGALYVWNVGYLDPNSAFAGTIELQTVLMVLAGGIGTVWGPVLGGILMSLVGTVLWARFPMEQQIVLGALTMLIAVALPGGLMSLLPQRGWLARPPIWGPPSTALEHAPLAAAQAAVAETSGPGPVLSCRGLSKRFGGVVAVDGVDLHVAPGEVLAVIGPNGAGKSTLFNLLSGFAVPSAGEVIFADRAISGIRPYVLARRGLARTFQTSRLFPTLSVWENVLLAASSRYRRKAQAVAAATELLERVGLREDWARLPQGLPPGRRRLLEIARALALEPSVLLLDEAMAGMTGPEIAQVQQVLRAAVARGSAIIAIEHVLPAIAPLAGRVQVLDFGRTIAEGTPAAVLHDPTVIAAYLGTDMAEAELAHA